MMPGSGMSLGGKRVVVIGGATGIGFAISELACPQDATIVIASSNKAKVSAAAERLRGATGRVVDLRDEASIGSFFGELGSFDHLAITAGDWGGSMSGSIRDLDLTQARELLANSVLGRNRGRQAWLPYDRPGRLDHAD